MKGVTGFIIILFLLFFGIQYLLNNVLNFHLLDQVLPFLFIGFVGLCLFIGVFTGD